MITTAILIKETAMDQDTIDTYYINPLVAKGISKDSIVVLPLLYNNNNKIPANTGKAYLDKLSPKIPDTVTKLVIADSPYFKYITGCAKIKDAHGITVQGKHTGYEKYTCAYVPNYRSIFRQPANEDLIVLGIKAITNDDNSSDLVIDYEEYGFKHGSDREILDQLFQHPELTVDIETTGLDISSSIISICFCWSKSEGVALDISINGGAYLKQFFEQYTGKLIFHKALFDVKLLIRWLWMSSESDFKGMNEGLQHFRNVDDTMILAYLEKNSTTLISLGLKELALEFIGKYAIDTSDLSKYSKAEILKYNLLDGLATFYLWEKFAHQRTSEAYTTIFRPSIPVLLKCMLVGLPMDHSKVQDAHKMLQAKNDVFLKQLEESTYIKEFTKILRTEECIKANKKLKKIRKTPLDFKDKNFNPNSHDQIGKLLHDYLKLPILETTDTGAPSTGGKILKDLINHTKDPDILIILEAIIGIAEITKIDGTFIEALMKEKHFLHGSLNLCTTQSGRLSSSDPNLQNLPSKGVMGKLIKSCIVAPTDLDGGLHINREKLLCIINSYKQPLEKLLTELYNLEDSCTEEEYYSIITRITQHPACTQQLLYNLNNCVQFKTGSWLFVGADFAALEERIGAILSNDPNRVKVYTDGYDSHSLRAHKYFADKMPDIVQAIGKAETATEFWIDDNGNYCCK
ncbi:MAG: DNA polymerase [Nanoarchaeota archaeon]|nr:DNA polymerase [Nanoarchaeota archaeon]